MYILLLSALLTVPVFAGGKSAPTPRMPGACASPGRAGLPPTPALPPPARERGIVSSNVARDHIAVVFKSPEALLAAQKAGQTPDAIDGLPARYIVEEPAPPLQAAPEAAVSQLTEAFAVADPGNPAKADAPSAAADFRKIFDGTAPMLRPAVEGWTVDGKEYASTAELAASLKSLGKPVDATYHFAHTAIPEPKARAANTVAGAAAGGLFGAAGGAVLAVIGDVMGPLMELVFFGSMSPGRGWEQLSLLTGGFAAFGALMGAVIAWEESGSSRHPRTSIRGRLYRQATENGGTLYFEPKRDGEAIVVNLDTYAGAPALQEPAAPAPWPAWKRAGMGAAWGLALAVAQWMPLVQIVALLVAGPYAGAYVGRALTQGTGITGGVLGAALGLVVTFLAFASFAAVQTYGFLLSFGAFAGLLMLAGALIGVLAADRIRAHSAREAARNPAGQWWVQASR